MLLTEIIINCAAADCPFYGICKVAQFPSGSHSPIIIPGWSAAESTLGAHCESYERIAEVLI